MILQSDSQQFEAESVDWSNHLGSNHFYINIHIGLWV